MNSALIVIKEQSHLDTLHAEDEDTKKFTDPIRGMIYLKEAAGSNFITLDFEIKRGGNVSDEELKSILKEFTTERAVKNLIKLKDERD